MKHHFKPTTYRSSIGSHDPVLRVADGDSIVTTTVDAEGRDHTGHVVTEAPNGQTGPFYVEGAEPGDTLAVRLDEIEPNRDHGPTCQTVAPNVLEPGHPREHLDSADLNWTIDAASNTATIHLPDSSRQRLAVPLRPMLGCFGVAPGDGQAISCLDADRHGGNMDYNGFTAGVTAYFPVRVSGALLHIGDGHAWQADGEILGCGIEVSMNVTLTVHVHRGKMIHWPRGENDHDIFTVGNAEPLDRALQHATSEMLRWLQADYGLAEQSAHLLLGTWVAYDVANMIVPGYTMVCKLPKRVITPIAERP